MTRAVGVIGAGNMGLAMALRLRDLGWSVTVRDIDPVREALARAEGLALASSPAALAADCDAVIVAVVDAVQTDAVLFGPDGAAATLAERAGVLLCPTLGPADTERFVARLDQQGHQGIDAPMSGGPLRARDGSMSLMVACPDDVFARWQPLIGALSSQVFRVGRRAGDGARTKLVNNLLAAINLAGAAEAMALAERIGLDAQRTLAVIERSSGQSWIGSDRMRRALSGDLAPRAHTTLLRKDSGLALEMAAQAGVALPLGAEAAALFAQASEAGYAALDDASLLEWLRRRGDRR